jgi:hypothetical protein
MKLQRPEGNVVLEFPAPGLRNKMEQPGELLVAFDFAAAARVTSTKGIGPRVFFGY